MVSGVPSSSRKVRDLRVVHVSPTFFSHRSVLGGGERYATELARFMAAVADTQLITFGSGRESFRIGDLRIEVYPASAGARGNRNNPFSVRFLSTVLKSDIVHVHQIHTVVSDLASMVGGLAGRRVFATDYGGGGFSLRGRIPFPDFYDGAIAYSAFGAEQLPAAFRTRTTVIRGGIDTFRFVAGFRKQRRILFVGRILPHKGIDYLIAAFRLLQDNGYTLRIIGQISDAHYYADLRSLAAGLSVEFLHDVDDERLVAEYQTASVTVLPSVHTDCYGRFTSVPELMGLTLLESQACGTPVVCTDAGAMSEFVCEGTTGEVVAQNSPEALAQGIRVMLGRIRDSERQVVEACRSLAVRYAWPEIITAHLRLYLGGGQ